ncbi:MAG: hypothetical protein HQL53_11095 [Magnetococcales bacterium]|nr:hypothetical protein [Magnetococcales bacterium]
MRKFILYTMSLLFIGAGGVIILASADHGLGQGNLDDLYAGLFMGGCLLLVGIMIWVAARKKGKRNKPGQKWDGEEDTDFDGGGDEGGGDRGDGGDGDGGSGD